MSTFPPIKNFPDHPPPGLLRAIEEERITIHCQAGVWEATDAERAEQIAATFDPTDYVKSEKSAELADARWQKETSGFMFQPAGADRPYLFDSSQRGVTAFLLASITIQKPREWKTAEVDAKGFPVFVTISAEDIPNIAQAISEHIDAAFVEEQAKLEVVKTADWQDVIDIKIAATETSVEAAPTVDK